MSKKATTGKVIKITEPSKAPPKKQAKTQAKPQGKAVPAPVKGGKKGTAPAPVKGKGKAAVKAAPKKVTFRERMQPVFQAPATTFTPGRSVPKKRNMTHFVKWPRYILVQRQRKILLSRLKTPPPIHLFDTSLDRATAIKLFAFLHKMRPEEAKVRRARRLAGAKSIAEALAPHKKVTKENFVAYQTAVKAAVATRPTTFRFGLNNVTSLIMKNKAKLVVIAHDVVPIELVVWLPALCRKKKVPFCIVKSKSRLGQLCHMKTATCLAVTRVRKEQQSEFAQLVDAIRPQFLENTSLLRKWGEPVMGLKHMHRERKIAKRVAQIEASKLKN